MSTTHRADRPTSTPRESGACHRLAWGAVALVPVFFFIAFAVGEGLYALMGYQPENADAPAWVVVVAAIPVLAVVLTPCAAAVLFGRRAMRDGDPRGRYPLIVGTIAGVGFLVLTIVSEVGNVVRR